MNMNFKVIQPYSSSQAGIPPLISNYSGQLTNRSSAVSKKNMFRTDSATQEESGSMTAGFNEY
jgi:hypothetical protein